MDISKSGNQFAIYGASKLGWFTRAVLNNYGLVSSCFIDKTAGKNFNNFHSTPVISREQFVAENKRLPIIVCVFNDEVRNKIIEELESDGLFVLATDPYAFLFTFFKKVASRKNDPERFAQSIEKLKKLYSLGKYAYGQIADELFVSPLVVGNVTQKCNLKCMDCGQYIPYYEDPKTFAVDNLVKEISSYCESVDLVPEVSLHGGEPFLHPEIGKICEELGKIPNLIFINLITNGTIYPKPENWALFKKAGVDIHQSDYRRISKRQAPIFELCEDNTIYCDINWTNDYEMWWRSPPVRDYKRTTRENNDLYRKCVSTNICAQITEGKLYRCPVAAHNIGKYPNIEKTDFVDLLDGTELSEKTIKVREYLTKKDCLSACGFCDPFGSKLVTPALQLSPRNKAIIASGGEIT
jgi:MoaA/NifB/PqqE/SkfB family radical SAM enzyme